MKVTWLPHTIIMVACTCVHAELCPTGQERFGGSCYQLLTETMTWEEAAETCSDMGGGLAVPNSLEEHQFIWEMFTRSAREGNVWTGCTDMEEEGKWVQPSEEGYECSYFDWAPGEPTNIRGQDCAQMWRGRGGKSDDTGCHASHFVICERAIGSIALTFCLQADADGRFTSPCLAGHVIKEFPTKDTIACGSACRDEPRCRSFNLRQGSHGEKICQLNSITHLEEVSKRAVTDDNCYYWEL